MLGEVRASWHRMQLGAALGDFFVREASRVSDAMLLMGDFNCEPFDPALVGESTGWKDRMVCVRERWLPLRPRSTLTYFYNPMWRFLGRQGAGEVGGTS